MVAYAAGRTGRHGWAAFGFSIAAAVLAACSAAPAPSPPPEPGVAEPMAAEPAPSAAASEPPAEQPPVEDAAPPPVVVAASWTTTPRPEEGIDSVAVWPGRGNRPWLLATARATDRLLVFDAGSGELLRELGSGGDGAGRFRVPRALVVADDLAFVAESGNARVQVLRLPGLSTVGFVAVGEGAHPAGLALVRTAAGVYELAVLAAATVVPDPTAAAGRVLRYEVEVAADGLAATPLAGADDLPAPGVSLACADGTGYRVAVEPAGVDGAAVFVVREPTGGAEVGRFVADPPMGAGGVTFSRAASEEFPAGAFYAADPAGVTAFDWRAVAAALGLREECAAGR